jgi:hypothetical protein
MTSSPTVTGSQPTDMQDAIARLRQRFSSDFEPAYIDNVVVPFFTSSVYHGERPVVPMIDAQFTKENAVPAHLWGLLSESWKLRPEDGVTVFLQGLENRGPGNRRKKIYMSAVTPDLYRPMYHDKVMAFLDTLLDDASAGQPLMRRYLDGYFDLYWHLHLGVRGDAIPGPVREIGHSFNTVLAYRDPTEKIVYDHYMSVRSHLDFLKRWIDDRVADLVSGRTSEPEKTFVYYWLKNGEESEFFQHKDVVFECFHNFLAFSQWGNTMYNIMLKLANDTGDPEIRAWFKKTMDGNFDQPDGGSFTPLERFIMELFRTISPNAGSISAAEETRTPPYERRGYVVSPHLQTSMDPLHWRNPLAFDPDRYLAAPTSHDIDEARCAEIGFAQCPFDRDAFEVKDGRHASLSNSGFGTVYGVVDGVPLPVCDYAGYAPFGFGYRRCPGEQLTIDVFADFLRTVWASRIEFIKLDITAAEPLPIGPATVIADNVTFMRRRSP